MHAKTEKGGRENAFPEYTVHSAQGERNKNAVTHTHTLLSLLLLSITASAHVRALYKQIAANDLTLQGKPSMQPYLGERK